MSFLFGALSSILLILCGNKQNMDMNKAIGYFYIYISLVQFFEFLMWSDIKCESGVNKLASNIMPLMVYMQPVVYHMLFSTFVYDKSNGLINNTIMNLINGAYAVLVLTRYNELEYTCTTTNEEQHLSWDFAQNDVKSLYNIMIFLNSINYIGETNMRVQLIWVYLMFALSYLDTKKNMGELWCFSSTSTPKSIDLSMLKDQYYI